MVYAPLPPQLFPGHRSGKLPPDVREAHVSTVAQDKKQSMSVHTFPDCALRSYDAPWLAPSVAAGAAVRATLLAFSSTAESAGRFWT